MYRYFGIFLALALFITPNLSFAATSLEVSGWIPWWQDSKGLKSATKQLSKLDTVYPFVYEVSSTGNLVDKAKLSESQWKKFFSAAEKKDVEVIPSIMWSDGTSIHAILSDSSKRATHIDQIVKMVEDGDFDGVNVDYESKLAETKDYFSLFLQELKTELDDKLLTCAIEARTPPDSLYRTVPANIEYSNDYKAIAQYCDRVELMTYDQQRADLKLNDARKGAPYVPVSDPEWVEKVVTLALKDIPAEKIMLGVPTYGRQWTLTVAPDWYKNYDGDGAINQPAAKKLASKYKVSVSRSSSNEAVFSYIEDKTLAKKVAKIKVPSGTSAGLKTAAQALVYATENNVEVPVQIVWYSDAKAIVDKVKIAEKYDLKGMAVFKIDGEEDQNIWKLF